MRFRLDTRLSEGSTIGARGGLVLDEGSALGQRLVGRLQEIRQALDEGVLPALRLATDRGQARAAMELGSSWRGGGRSAPDRLIVVGEAGAVAAATLLARALPGTALAMVDRPDRASVVAALAGARRPSVLALAGPRWVQTAVKAMQVDPARVLIALDEPAEVSSWGRPWVAPGAADGRFGSFGPAGLGLLGWAAAGDPDLLAATVEALIEVGEAVSGVASRSNPAVRLALVARGMEAADASCAPALVASTANLQAWASWAASSWMALRSRSAPRGTAFEPLGGTPLVCAAGDEAAIQRLCEGVRGPWGVLLGIQGPPADDLAAERQALLDAQGRVLSNHGRAAVSVQVRDDAAPALAQLSVWWSVGCLLATAVDAADPLTMDAADRLRQDLSALS